MNRETFPLWLQERMTERSWTQADLARHMRTNSSTVKRWLDGSIPHAKTLSELQSLLKPLQSHLKEEPIEYIVRRDLAEVFSLTISKNPALALEFCMDFITQARGGDASALEKAEMLLKLFAEHLQTQAACKK